ncbi:unnamed protein product [Paramecium pentaurelia]|uniref:Uncharacterized protein n=1 Tax=Paramecium pentaurelia TaxID=43138 RepID=A0A8S1W3C9_9CILI|nr:unnamed protein product [Paramecium pentaurelia]
MLTSDIFIFYFIDLLDPQFYFNDIKYKAIIYGKPSIKIKVSIFYIIDKSFIIFIKKEQTICIIYFNIDFKTSLKRNEQFLKDNTKTHVENQKFQKQKLINIETLSRQYDLIRSQCQNKQIDDQKPVTIYLFLKTSFYATSTIQNNLLYQKTEESEQKDNISIKNNVIETFNLFIYLQNFREILSYQE